MLRRNGARSRPRTWITAVACVVAISGLGLLVHTGDLHPQIRPDCAACVAGVASSGVETPVVTAPDHQQTTEPVELDVAVARRGSPVRLRETRAPPA